MNKSIPQKSEQDPASAPSPQKNTDLPWTKGDIPTRKGNCNVLLIAPHGHPKNDENTYEIGRMVADELDCYAIASKIYRKPPFKKKKDGLWYLDKNRKKVRHAPDKAKKWIDLNRKNQVHAHLESEFEKPLKSTINEIIEKYGKAMVLWLHGIRDDNLTSDNMEVDADGINALIGIGQGNPDRYTANEKTVTEIISALGTNSINPLKAALAKSGSRYCGWHENIMNQFFRTEGYALSIVESIQLEIGYDGVRNPQEKMENTASAIAKSLGQLIRPIDLEKEPNDELVAEAFQTLKNIFTEHFHNAMLHAGGYIINTFYGKDPHRVLKNDPVKDKSLNQLVIELKQNEGSVPSRGWFYNAVNLAAQETISQEEGFQTFGKIGHSQKLLLLPYPKLKKLQADTFEEKVKIAFGEKEKCAKYAHDNNLSVREFKKYIDEQNPSKAIDLTALPPKVELRKRDQKELVRLRNTAKKKIEDGQEKIGIYGKALNHLDAVLAEKGNKNHKGKGRFRDWTLPGNNVNIYTGCKNDCLYCYANLTAQRYQRVEPGEWSKLEVRRDDVEKSRKLLNGLVGFPSTHDIFPENLDNYLIVLGKLLRAGNEVLIVTKPNIKCIKAICNASIYFKDKILFRFTIGANDDDILSFWEPNAPKYEERKASLRYARENGFRTSVSMEPMLDTPQIKKTIADLRPFVTEDIWLGTMNHLNQIKAGLTNGYQKK